MLLVHQKKGSDGKWEVAWMWLPTFLSTNHDLVKYVDSKMTEEFKGKDLNDPDLQWQMHLAVIDHIVEKNPIKGLKSYLQATVTVQIDDGHQEIPA